MSAQVAGLRAPVDGTGRSMEIAGRMWAAGLSQMEPGQGAELLAELPVELSRALSEGDDDGFDRAAALAYCAARHEGMEFTGDNKEAHAWAVRVARDLVQEALRHG